MTKRKKAATGSSAELAEMFPAPQALKVRVAESLGDGKDRRYVYRVETVNVCALPLCQLGHVVDALAPLINDKEGADVMQLATEHRAMVYEAFAQATGWSVAEIGNIHPADFLAAVNAIIAANADFFVRLLGPGVLETPAQTATPPNNGAGPTQSASSAIGATPPPNAIPSPSSALQ